MGETQTQWLRRELEAATARAREGDRGVAHRVESNRGEAGYVGVEIRRGISDFGVV